MAIQPSCPLSSPSPPDFYQQELIKIYICKIFKFTIKNLPTMTTLDPDKFTSEFYETLRNNTDPSETLLETRGGGNIL